MERRSSREFGGFMKCFSPGPVLCINFYQCFRCTWRRHGVRHRKHLRVLTTGVHRFQVSALIAVVSYACGLRSFTRMTGVGVFGPFHSALMALEFVLDCFCFLLQLLQLSHLSKTNDMTASSASRTSFCFGPQPYLTCIEKTPGLMAEITETLCMSIPRTSPS